MAVTFDSDSIEGVFIGVGTGTLSPLEIMEAADGMWRQIKGPHARILWDLRAARFDLDSASIQNIGEFAKTHAPPLELRMAFVVARDLEFGLVRMFEVFREMTGVATSVFRDMEHARDWLGASHEPEET